MQSKSRSQQKELTEARILACATELFDSEGFDTSMRKIATYAGVAAGTIFIHFKDKHALLARILHDRLEVAAKAALCSVDSGKTLENNLVSITSHIYDSYFQNPGLSRSLLKEVIFEKQQEGEVSIISNQVIEFMTEVAKLFHSEILKGNLSKEIDIKSVCDIYFSIYFTNLLKHLKSDVPSLTDALDDFKRVLTLFLVSITET